MRTDTWPRQEGAGKGGKTRSGRATYSVYPMEPWPSDCRLPRLDGTEAFCLAGQIIVDHRVEGAGPTGPAGSVEQSKKRGSKTSIIMTYEAPGRTVSQARPLTRHLELARTKEGWNLAKVARNEGKIKSNPKKFRFFNILPGRHCQPSPEPARSAEPWQTALMSSDLARCSAQSQARRLLDETGKVPTQRKEEKKKRKKKASGDERRRTVVRNSGPVDWQRPRATGFDNWPVRSIAWIHRCDTVHHRGRILQSHYCIGTYVRTVRSTNVLWC